MVNLVAYPRYALQGECTIPGDKSITHRAIILASIAQGEMGIHGYLHSEDCLATLRIMRLLGVKICIQGTSLRVQGVGLHGLKACAQPLDCGNSGTTMRLLAGLLAVQSFSSTLYGDKQLARRPMARVVLPLRDMGARIQGQCQQGEEAIYSPLYMQPVSTVAGLCYTLPVASAQVKSCLLLAALYAHSVACLVEKEPTRDHTERLLAWLGCSVQRVGKRLYLVPPYRLTAKDIRVPGDLSSAAFFIVAASFSEGSHILLKAVGVNPQRIGVITILRRMGAEIRLLNERLFGNEPVADIEVRGRALQGIEIPQEWVVSAIDEFPALFIAAANARGQTCIRGIQELRFKETDRIAVMVTGLRALGVPVMILPDGVVIQGAKLSGGRVDSAGDHRVAMAFAIASIGAKGPISIQQCENIGTSFPTFSVLACGLGLAMGS